jgi:hypothetical protein
MVLQGEIIPANPGVDVSGEFVEELELRSGSLDIDS